jgi:hypothetical protein
LSAEHGDIYETADDQTPGETTDESEAIDDQTPEITDDSEAFQDVNTTSESLSEPISITINQPDSQAINSQMKPADPPDRSETTEVLRLHRVSTGTVAQPATPLTPSNPLPSKEPQMEILEVGVSST